MPIVITTAIYYIAERMTNMLNVRISCTYDNVIIIIFMYKITTAIVDIAKRMMNRTP